MSRKVKAAAIQMRCSNNVGDNIKKADEMTREAVKKGANIIPVSYTHLTLPTIA